jgi:predicted regulator of amino acid metabolism with ACT domain
MPKRETERRVEIVEEPDQTYKWIAIEQRTRRSLLRLHDLNQLSDVCHRLGWKVVDVKPESARD